MAEQMVSSWYRSQLICRRGRRAIEQLERDTDTGLGDLLGSVAPDE